MVFCIMLFFSTTATSSVIVDYDPASGAEWLIKDLYDKPGTLRISIASAEPLYLITSERISAGTQISQEQVCFGKGDFAETNIILLDEKNGQERVLFANKEWLPLKVGVVCNKGKTSLIESLRNDTEIPGEGLPTCNLCGDDETCCAVVFLKRFSEQNISNVAFYEGNVDQLIKTKSKLIEGENFNKFILNLILPLIALIAVIIAIAFIFWKIRVSSIMAILQIFAIPGLFYFILSYSTFSTFMPALLLVMLIPIILAVVFWRITKTKIPENKKRLIAISILVIDVVHFSVMTSVVFSYTV